MDEDLYNKIVKEGRIQLEHEYEKYISGLKERVSDINNFIKISELEQRISDISKNSNKLYTDIASRILSSVNEEELIESKKENIDERG